VGLRVLVVDDDLDFIKAFVGFLEDAGHTVVQVSNWYEVIPIMTAFVPDVALVDLKMPGIRGEDVARTLKRFSGVKVYIHSGASQDELAQALVKSQADGIFPKGRPREALQRLTAIESELALARTVDSQHET
jgi:CheY-like chemotaxis protein